MLLIFSKTAKQKPRLRNFFNDFSIVFVFQYYI